MNSKWKVTLDIRNCSCKRQRVYKATKVVVLHLWYWLVNGLTTQSFSIRCWVQCERFQLMTEIPYSIVSLYTYSNSRSHYLSLFSAKHNYNNNLKIRINLTPFSALLNFQSVLTQSWSSECLSSSFSFFCFTSLIPTTWNPARVNFSSIFTNNLIK